MQVFVHSDTGGGEPDTQSLFPAALTFSMTHSVHFLYLDLLCCTTCCKTGPCSRWAAHCKDACPFRPDWSCAWEEGNCDQVSLFYIYLLDISCCGLYFKHSIAFAFMAL